MKRKILIFILILTVAGCAHYTLIQPVRHPIGSLYTVKSQIAWSKAMEGKIELWTVDGPLLEAIRFINGLEDGDNILLIKGKKSNLPHFRAHMTPSEVLEFFVGSVKSIAGGVEAEHLAKGVVPPGIRSAGINASTVQATNLRPARFGTLSGYRFDLSFRSKEGLERKGIVIGTIHEKCLYLIIYTGAKEYYYPKYKEEVERIISSIQIKT
jgi:hypothetical protein